MTIDWNTNVYAQERSILTASAYNASTVVIRIESTSPSGIAAEYTVPAGMGALQVDMTDLIRVAYSAGLNNGTFKVQEIDGDGEVLTEYTSTYLIVGRINPLTAYKVLPNDGLADEFELSVAPPSVMYEQLNVNARPIVFEMAAGGSGSLFTNGRIKFLPQDWGLAFGRTVSVLYGTKSLEFYHLNDFANVRYQMRELECGKRYAEVEWVSFTGQTRRHVFEVVKLTEETTNDVSLETLTNEYDVRKDRRVSFSLRLEGLTAYDYWYYSDLVTSSSVKVSLSGTNYRQVQVTAKKSTTPETSAGKPLNLEIPINYVRYDTL